MWKNIGYDKCLAFIECQFHPRSKESAVDSSIKPTITISRMTGAGGRTVAAKLAEYLQMRAPTPCHWTIFDRNLMEKVLEDHHLQKRIADLMPEDHKSIFTDALEELLGLHPSTWKLVQDTAETILRLAQLGNVVLVGRGGNVITARLRTAFHVRVVGSLEKRIERVEQVYNLDRKGAVQFIKDEDKGRRRYLKENFDKDIDDPLLYHLIVNTDLIGYEDAAQMIGDEVIKRFHLSRGVRAPAA